MTKPFTLADLAYALHPPVPFRVMCALARRQARLQYLLRRRERAIVRSNLEAAFGEEYGADELDRLSLLAFEHRQLRALMLTLVPRLRPEQIARLFPMDGIDHLDRAPSRGRGAILAMSHLNSICNFIAVELLRARGYDLRVAMPADPDPYPASALRRALNRLTGGASFPERTGAFQAQFNLRPIVRQLAAGTGVALVADGWHSAAFVEVDFLGRPLYFTTGPMSVARLSGSPVVPMFALGAPPDRLRFVFEEPILPDPELEAKEDIERMTRRYVGRLERHLRENVPCWQHWFEPRALETMASLPRRSLAERYEVTPGAGTQRGP